LSPASEHVAAELGGPHDGVRAMDVEARDKGRHGTEDPVSDSYISAEMLGVVGRLLGSRVSFPISESDIRRWAIATYYPDPPPRLFWDAAYAATTRHGGIVAPEEFNPFAWMSGVTPPGDPESATATPPDSPSSRSDSPTPKSDSPNDPDRTERSLGIPGPGLAFMVNGGMEVEYGVRMRAGDVITSESRLAGYTEREGRLGRMLFTSSETVWTNQDAELVKRSTGTIIRY
jgi:hypothetical protein